MENAELPRHVRDWLSARRVLTQGRESVLDELRRPVAWKRLAELGTFGLMLMAGEWLVVGVSNPVARLLGVLLVGVALNTFFLLLHEGMHYILWPGRLWNRWLSVALGASTLISFTAYQVLHLRHHKFLGDPRDPDDYDNYQGPIWLMHYTRLLTGAFLYIVFIPLKAWKVGSRAEQLAIIEEYALMGLAYGWLYALVPHAALLWGWLVPLLGVGVFTNIRGLTQHTLTQSQDPYLASRSVHLPRPLAWLLLHENLHMEHHLFPEVPSYHLEALHRLIWDRMPRAVVTDSYLGFVRQFVRASLRSDRRPLGVVEPHAN